MSTEWKPGDVAMDPQHGVALVMTSTFGGCPELHKARGLHIHYGNGDWNTLIDRLRPLVVIDPEDREQVERLAWEYVGEFGGSANEVVVDAFQAALREFAAPKPPKPEEPTGLGAVVEDAEGALWVRVGVTIGDLHWRSTEPGNTNCFKWRAIEAVKVLSEGVQP